MFERQEIKIFIYTNIYFTPLYIYIYSVDILTSRKQHPTKQHPISQTIQDEQDSARKAGRNS